MASLDSLQIFLGELDKGQRRLNDAIRSANEAAQQQFEKELTLAQNGLMLDQNGNLIRSDRDIIGEINAARQARSRSAVDPNLTIGPDGSLIVDPNSELAKEHQRKQQQFDNDQARFELDQQARNLKLEHDKESNPLRREILKNNLEIIQQNLEILERTSEDRIGQAKTECISFLPGS